MTTTRPMTATEHEAFTLARLRLLNNSPYYAAAAFAVAPVAAEGLGTWACDKNWRLYIDPTCLPDAAAGWTAAQCGEVFEHELNHLLRDHAARMAAHAGDTLDPQRSNIACDAEINDDLSPQGFIANIGITPSKLGLPDSNTAEWYYDNLPAQGGDQGDGEGEGGGQGDGEGDGQGDGNAAPTAGAGKCGSGAGGNPIDGELDANSPDAPSLSEGKATLARKAVAQAVEQHVRANGRGSAPAGLQEWARITLAPPTVPWRHVLAAEIRRGVRQTRGMTDYTYGRVSRRSRTTPGIITPALVSPKPRISAVVDTSGSMSMDDITAALNEIHGIANASGCTGEELSVIQVDADVANVRPFTTRPEVCIEGRGGTDMRVGIERGLEMNSNIIVVLTDGMTPWPTERPRRATVVAAIVGDADSRKRWADEARNLMPWARVVEVGGS